MRKLISLFLILVSFACSHAQSDSTRVHPPVSGFDRFNARAEALFKILPVPIYSYSSEAGNIFGLAKYNLFHLLKKDPLSGPSKMSGVFTVSTKGRINASLANELVFDENKYVIVSSINYKRQVEYIFGIGNDVKRENAEQVTLNRFVFHSTGLKRIRKNLYLGLIFNAANYFGVEVDSTGFLASGNVAGLNGGIHIGLGMATVFDSRDSRYNPSKGSYGEFGFSQNFGAYTFTRFHFDLRKYWKPFPGRTVIALQTTTFWAQGEVPFYELSMLGGDSRMRGYYQGALRDKVSVDAQMELRVPVWKIFGITGFVGAGQVAGKYTKLSIDGFWPVYGGGLRIRVDSKNNTNLRFDAGFGPQHIRGFYISFAEAF